VSSNLHYRLLMMKRKCLAGAAVSHALKLIVASGFYMGSGDPIQAPEKKTYTRVPFTASPVKCPMHCWDPINMKNRSGICTTH